MDKVQISLLMIMVSCGSIGLYVSTMDSESKTISEKMEIVQKGEGSNDPVMKKQAGLARAELVALQAEKEAEQRSQAERAKLEPYERIETWLIVLIAVVGIVGLPVLFKMRKYG